MSREGIITYEELMDCQILDKYNLTDRKVPALTVKGKSIKFNLNAIHMLGDPLFVQILINREEKYLLVKPCENEFDVYSIDWCKKNKKNGKVESKDITSKFLSPKLYELMGWERKHSYKLQCIFQDFGNGRTLLFFDLNEYVTLVSAETTTAAGTVRKCTTPYYLANWKDSFGPTFSKVVDQVNMDYSGYYMFKQGDSNDETVFRRPPNNENRGEVVRYEC